MLAEMRPSDLGTWMALNTIDPWGEGRADLRAGVVASTIANTAGKVSKTDTVPADFMPYVERPKRTLKDSLLGFLKGVPIKKKV